MCNRVQLYAAAYRSSSVRDKAMKLQLIVVETGEKWRRALIRIFSERNCEVNDEEVNSDMEYESSARDYYVTIIGIGGKYYQ
ncbi:hypothetical protein GWI33_001582 [Rhynchophorus ferrugineus]|uniref:Uncharacterized protein n=1 Tax=Rhynchophorus ferrugineus TaxID=354439 RepID=A0A834ILN0_RHYFE|nr:hypothetical protein GWI33_001582 [Rhynchophorus ferrugineus]